MANLKELLAIEGVVAAGEFSDDGALLALEGDLTEEEGAMAAQMCSANKKMMQMQVDGYTALSKEDGWTPAMGFAIAGPKLSICVVGNIGVFVETGKGSFNKVMQALQAQQQSE